MAHDDDIKVQTKDTDAGVVSRAQVDVHRLRSVAAAQIVLLDFDLALEALLHLMPTDGDVHALLVAPDAERVRMV
jgi:hypothetical protein